MIRGIIIWVRSTPSNRPKLLARLLMSGGIERAREVVQLAAPAVKAGVRPVVITGGSGFIGSNLADSFLADGRDVIVFDNLSRPGVEQNLHWLAGPPWRSAASGAGGSAGYDRDAGGASRMPLRCSIWRRKRR